MALGFYESLTVGTGALLVGTIIYSFGGSPWTITFGGGSAQPGTGVLSYCTFRSSAGPPVIVGVPDGAAVSVVIQYIASGGATIETATFTGYTWDATTGLQNLVGVGSSSALTQILEAVTRSWT
jgi:hypothetical protein